MIDIIVLIPFSNQKSSYEDIDKLLHTSNSQIRWRTFRSNPALRRYHPGETIDYLAILYHASSLDKKVSQWELQTTLYKDGELCHLAAPETIQLSEKDALGRIVLRKSLTLPPSLEEGSYLLELTVTNKQSPKSRLKAKQKMDFEIHKEPSDSQHVINSKDSVTP